MKNSFGEIWIKTVKLHHVIKLLQRSWLAEIVENKLVLENLHFFFWHRKVLESIFNFLFFSLFVILLLLKEIFMRCFDILSLLALFLHLLPLFVLFNGLVCFAHELLQDFKSFEPVSSAHNMCVGLIDYLIKVHLTASRILFEHPEVFESKSKLATKEWLEVSVVFLLATELERCVVEHRHCLVVINMLSNQNFQHSSELVNAHSVQIYCLNHR